MDSSPSPSVATVKSPEGFVLPTAPIKLNVGGGQVKIPGYTNIDIEDGIRMDRLPYPDESVDEVYASHVLEHVPHWENASTLREWKRVLKPGGVLKIAVPDIGRIQREVADVNRTPTHMMDDWLFGGHVTEHDVHHQHFTEQKLRLVMTKAGFRNVRPFEPFVADCSLSPVSLNLEAHKPLRRPRTSYQCRVVCVISQGYLTFSPMMQSVLEVVQKMPFQVIQHTGAFWDKSLTAGIKLALKHDPEYILTIDHDSVFTQEDVANLLRIMDSNTDLDALFPVQMSRHDDRPLVFRDGIRYEGEFTRVPFGHFGLTMIRSRVFEDLQQPWFWSVPGPNGDWDAHPQSDADITFWRTMMEHGHVVAQANNVLLGHMILSVKWPHPQGLMLQPIQYYQAAGRPPEARFDPRAYDRSATTNPQPQASPAETPEMAQDAHAVLTGEEA